MCTGRACKAVHVCGFVESPTGTKPLCDTSEIHFTALPFRDRLKPYLCITITQTVVHLPISLRTPLRRAGARPGRSIDNSVLEPRAPTVNLRVPMECGMAKSTANIECVSSEGQCRLRVGRRRHAFCVSLSGGRALDKRECQVVGGHVGLAAERKSERTGDA